MPIANRFQVERALGIAEANEITLIQDCREAVSKFKDQIYILN